MTRYAIYSTPPIGSPLWQLGSSIIGYDAATGVDAPFPDDALFHDPLSLAWSAEPRRYGFHGTLKAPFRLAAGLSADALRSELGEFARGRPPFDLDLTLAPVGHFLALVTPEPPGALQNLADDCVRHFDPFREPLTPEDRERRHPDNLIERQVGHLDTWGYPYVFEDFTFHMTLTGSLSPDDRHRLEPVLQRLLGTVPLRTRIESVALFRQDDPEGRFVIDSQYPFAA